jgi:hypothetical protein
MIRVSFSKILQQQIPLGIFSGKVTVTAFCSHGMVFAAIPIMNGFAEARPRRYDCDIARLSFCIRTYLCQIVLGQIQYAQCHRIQNIQELYLVPSFFQLGRAQQPRQVSGLTTLFDAAVLEPLLQGFFSVCLICNRSRLQ